jgi:hypothetical protein
MRSLVTRAAIALAALAGALWLWRTPSAALVRLKLALDRHDLAGVERGLDRAALTDEALAHLVEERPGEAERVRLVLRGKGGWLPAIESARQYLRIHLERTIARLVEEPESALHVSWAGLQESLATLHRSGAVAMFTFRDDGGEEYRVRMRQRSGRWRIVAVERNGEPLLLAPLVPAAAPVEPPAPSEAPVDATETAAGPPEEAPGAGAVEERFAMLLSEAAELADGTPPPRPRRISRTPFARRLDGATWTVQVASSKDAVEAEVEREWFARNLARDGEPAFVVPADVGGARWQRVMIGRFATQADAERVVARLTEQLGSLGLGRP